MSRDEAIRALSGYFCTWYISEDEIGIDGDITKDQLRAILWIMDNEPELMKPFTDGKLRK